MIDINLLRENPELIKENQKRLGQDEKIVDEILKIDEKWRKLKYQADSLRAERNKISQQINEEKKTGNEKKAQELIQQAQEIPEKIKSNEELTEKTKQKRDLLLSKIPNIISPHTPQGKDDKENPEIKRWGTPIKHSFPIKNHVELIEELNLGSFDDSAKTSGNGFYYLKGKLALLNQALIRFTIDFMNKKGYIYVEPPLMIRKEIMESSEGLDSIKQSIYEISQEDLVLIGTAEHALMAMHTQTTFDEKELPKKYFSYSMCFRKEIGAHGINEKGLWRTHQFNKVEQFIFCLPEQSEKLYQELLANSEEILQSLELPYRVIEICTGDLAKWKHRSADLEVWRPTTKSYGEVMSLSNITDYQARDHEIKVLRKNNQREVVHTLNNTALATSRILVAILENFQLPDSSIAIPKALWKYTGFKKIRKEDGD
jgi:seryl-tRNA synthetase